MTMDELMASVSPYRRAAVHNLVACALMDGLSGHEAVGRAKEVAEAVGWISAWSSDVRAEIAVDEYEDIIRGQDLVDQGK